MKKQKEWGGRKLSMTTLEIPVEYRFDNFNEKAINVLNEILEETGAEIVVSSDWKNWCSVEEMGDTRLYCRTTLQNFKFSIIHLVALTPNRF